MKQFIFVFQTWYYLLGFTLEGFKQQETQYSYELQHCKSSLQPLIMSQRLMSGFVG